ncbi:hypothetical protein JHK85_015565 [Glycine max]|uniref:Uncharacterized protein n=1 Tax=Glycine max TaxID=3847 RepID=K7KUV5_SOYBN|nr:hypothetical protein JHK85_015565 [Glycine max]KAG5045803.1 hypothetical protein JHK86_015209 [Glycine max]
MHIMSPRTRLHSLQLQLPSSKPIQIGVLLFSLSFQPIDQFHVYKTLSRSVIIIFFFFQFSAFFLGEYFKLFIYDRLIC